MLRDKKPYSDLGADYFDKLDTARIERHHVRRLEQLGYTVRLTPKLDFIHITQQKRAFE